MFNIFPSQCDGVFFVLFVQLLYPLWKTMSHTFCCSPMTRGLVLIMLLFVYMFYSRNNCHVATYFRKKSKRHSKEQIGMDDGHNISVCLSASLSSAYFCCLYMSASVCLSSLSPLSLSLFFCCYKQYGCRSCVVAFCVMYVYSLEGVHFVSGRGSYYLLARRHVRHSVRPCEVR